MSLPPRLFVGIELGRHWAEMLLQTRIDLPGARWENQPHLTLGFVGALDGDRARDLDRRLGRIAVAGFELSFADWGWFGPDDAPRIIWQAVTASPPLVRLRQAVLESIHAIGIERDERPFVPHITIARCGKADPQAVLGFLETGGAKPLPPMPVTEFVLFESVSTNGGAVYSRRRTYPLRRNLGASADEDRHG